MQDGQKNWWTRTKEWLSYEYEDAPLEAFTTQVTDTPQTVDGSLLPPSRLLGPAVDPRVALTVNPVYSAVRILSNSVSQLPLQVMRGGKEVPAPSLISQPDVNMTLTNFLALTVNHLALWGNCYWRLRRDVDSPTGNVISVQILNPELVYVTLYNGKKVYQYTDQILQDWQVLNLMIMPTFDPATQILRGRGPVQVNHAEIQMALQLNDYLRNFFGNNGIPTGILTTDGYLAEGEGDAIRSRWYEIDAVSGLQVLPNGLTYQQIAVNPAQLGYNEIATKLVCDIARVFGIPDRYLLAAIEHTSMSYQNMQDVDRQLVMYTLMAYINQIEDGLSSLLPRGQTVVMNTDAFLRGSPTDRYQALALADFMTVNEKRALSGLDPIAGGNKLSAPKPIAAPAAQPTSNEGEPPTN